MQRFVLTLALAALVSCLAATTHAQSPELPKAGPEFDVLKADVGRWDVEIKVWNGPGDPTVTKGAERNRMLGGFWMLTDFEGNMMGMEFRGHGMYSYDADKKQYIGTWVDSLGPTKMEMIGKHDNANNTMTYEGIGPAPDGTPTKHVMTTKYAEDGTRVMTMQMKVGDELVKVFEMHYTKAKPRR